MAQVERFPHLSDGMIYPNKFLEEWESVLPLAGELAACRDKKAADGEAWAA